MGCNCKANRSIAYIRKSFGEGNGENKEKSSPIIFYDILRAAVIYAVLILTVPFVFIWVLIQLISGKKQLMAPSKFIKIFKK